MTIDYSFYYVKIYIRLTILNILEFSGGNYIHTIVLSLPQGMLLW